MLISLWLKNIIIYSTFLCDNYERWWICISWIIEDWSIGDMTCVDQKSKKTCRTGTTSHHKRLSRAGDTLGPTRLSLSLRVIARMIYLYLDWRWDGTCHQLERRSVRLYLGWACLRSVIDLKVIQCNYCNIIYDFCLDCMVTKYAYNLNN